MNRGQHNTPEIEDVTKIVPDALHGTDDESCKKIFKNNSFKHSPRHFSFLGNGVYFWEGSFLLARRWAIRKAKENNSFKYAIIKATINLGVCLDLNKPEHIELVENVADKLQKKLNYPLNDPVVINFINDNFINLDTVRALNPKSKKPIFKGSRYINKTEPLICVKNNDKILEYSICEKDNV